MLQQSTAIAKWTHRPGSATPALMRAWLKEAGSLTEKLKARSTHFRVRRLNQQLEKCLADEACSVGLRRRMQVRQREVLLECDGQPAVFAHSIVPLNASAADWPFFRGLGERSLGSSLFGDPRICRGRLEFAKLRASHPLVKRAVKAAQINLQYQTQSENQVYARRCLYRRKQGLLLVTELFLPLVAQGRLDAQTIDIAMDPQGAKHLTNTK